MQGYEQRARMLKAMGHPARLRILDALEDGGEACVCHLQALLGLRQAYLSQQLAILREAGLLRDRREGLFVFYRLADERVRAVLALLRGEAPREHTPPSAGFLPHCSCPKCQRRRRGSSNVHLNAEMTHKHT